MIEYPYQEPHPMGGTDAEPEPREHTCPIGLDEIHCQNCFFIKEGLCDWPHTRDGSAAGG